MQQSPPGTPTALLAALGNPARLKLVALLGEGERCACELTPEFRQDPSVVCRHLKVLEHAGIVRSRRAGVRIYYQLADARILELIVNAWAIIEKPAEAKPVGSAASARHPGQRLSGSIHSGLESVSIAEKEARLTNRPAEEVRKAVRTGYASVALGSGSCCGPSSSCCSSAADVSRTIGYSDADLKAVPEGANLGLGCGNPVALASLNPGEVVLDLGSGSGFDCFLAAQQVGPAGRVIGVDMTPEMIDRARANAARADTQNVEFRLGEIEHLPVADRSVDVVISNCVINLSPNKPQVFREAFRVLKPGGRLMISDIVLAAPLPADLLESTTAYVGCISGASLKADYLAMIAGAGFEHVEVLAESRFLVDAAAGDPALQALARDSGMTAVELESAAAAVRSISVSAARPKE